MSRYVVIACASVGIFAVSAASLSPTMETSRSPSSGLTATVLSTVFSSDTDTTPIDTSSTHYALLRGVYGGTNADPDPSTALPAIDEETLWLARAIYSETRLPHEQELVAWVIRNRVETKYRGERTYKGVVLDPYQFSAFNPNAPRRSFYTSLTPANQLPAWQQALRIAHYVRHADPAYRPFSIKTRHFFSEIAMPNRDFPYWVEHHRFVSPGWSYQVDAERFRFYKSIS